MTNQNNARKDILFPLYGHKNRTQKKHTDVTGHIGNGAEMGLKQITDSSVVSF